MNVTRVRAELLAIRARVDEVLVALDEASPTAAPAPWVKVATYAEHASVSVETVRRWVKLGMPHSGMGKLVRIHVERADQWRSSIHSSSAKTPGGGS